MWLKKIESSSKFQGHHSLEPEGLPGDDGEDKDDKDDNGEAEKIHNSGFASTVLLIIIVGQVAFPFIY